MDEKPETSIKQIVEGLIFAADDPLTPKQIRELIEGDSGNGSADSAGLTPQKLSLIINELNEEYEKGRKPYRIRAIAGGYLFATVRDVSAYVGKLHREQAKRRLTQAALETLAIIAYKQPITKVELETIRGVNCDYVIKSLLEKDLIAIVGRQQSVGRPLLYGTTKKFLMHFGLNSLNELPKPREIEQLIDETQSEVEKRLLELERRKQEEEEEMAQKRNRKPHPLSEGATAKIIPLKPDYRPVSKQEPVTDEQPAESKPPHVPEQTSGDSRVTENDTTDYRQDEIGEMSNPHDAPSPAENQAKPAAVKDEPTAETTSATREERNEEALVESGQETIPEYHATEPDDDALTQEMVLQNPPVADGDSDDETLIGETQQERGWKKWKNRIVKIIKKIFG